VYCVPEGNDLIIPPEGGGGLGVDEGIGVWFGLFGLGSLVFF
jgi:hypothetical protein